MSGGRALVAGAAGFLGSHLVDALLADGWSVVGLDSLLTGRLANIEHLASNDDFTFIEGEAEGALGSATGAFGLVLHFASAASPPRYSAHPLETLHAGSVATEALLDVARRDGARFVLASTSEVYGDPLVHPQSEDYWGNVNPNGPRSMYDEAKRYAEALTAVYRRSFGVDTGIVRIFNTYGPRIDPDDGRAIPAFIRAALAGDPVPLHGDGSQTRSLTYVADLVDGIMRMSLSREPGPINLGNPREQTLREVAELVIAISGSSSQVVLQPRPADDPERRRPDITRARNLLGWEPSVPAEKGLMMTVDWFRTHEASPDAE